MALMRWALGIRSSSQAITITARSRVALLPRPHSPGLQSFVGQCGQLPGGFSAKDFSLAAHEDPKLPGGKPSLRRGSTQAATCSISLFKNFYKGTLDFFGNQTCDAVKALLSVSEFLLRIDWSDTKHGQK
jgi:hypothetical protein